MIRFICISHNLLDKIFTLEKINIFIFSCLINFFVSLHHCLSNNNNFMRRFISISILTLLAIATMSAQKTQDPKGLFRLQKFIYEDGSDKTPDFSQYKYAADSVGLLVSYRQSSSPQQWSQMAVEIREPHPLKNTGEKPQGADGHDIQIFNVSDKGFYFKWYNTQWANMSKLNEFITEVYGTDGIENEVAKAFNLLENKSDAKDNKLYGWWIRIAATANPDGTGRRQQVPTIWKAYSPGLSMVVRPLNRNTLGCSPTTTVKYENDSTIYETSHICNIKWLNDDCHALTFVQENNIPLTEIWVRGGLPRMWQSIFKTNVEIFRDASECIRLAVETAHNGDLKKAEEFMDEAINDKNVGIEPFCQGVSGITFLLYSKKNYKDCQKYCTKYLQQIDEYAKNGHDHNMGSKLYCYEVGNLKAISTYRSGDTEKGRKMMDECLSVLNSEIEQYRGVNGMDMYIAGLNYMTFMMYDLGYDIFGAEQTLLNLDALTLISPFLTSGSNKPQILECRGNCYLLLGDKDNARKLWQQVKEINPNYFKNKRVESPLKNEFGE